MVIKSIKHGVAAIALALSGQAFAQDVQRQRRRSLPQHPVR